MSTTTISSTAEPTGSQTNTARSPWAALPVVLSGAFMVVLDFFIVNVAMPSMQTDLHASSGALEWVAAGYGLTTAVFLITAGRLGDRIGRRRTFTLGLALFTVSSIACGAADTGELLIAGRLLQGVGGALLMTNLLSLIGVMFEGPDRAKALSAYGMTLGLAAVSGQLIGGVLVQANIAGLGWRSCFLINVPIGLAALAVTTRVVPESRAPTDEPDRPRRHGARHRWSHRGAVAARRGPPARLAAVDVGVAWCGAGDPRCFRVPSAHAA